MVRGDFGQPFTDSYGNPYEAVTCKCGRKLRIYWMDCNTFNCPLCGKTYKKDCGD